MKDKKNKASYLIQIQAYKIVRKTDREIFPKIFNWRGEDKKTQLWA